VSALQQEYLVVPIWWRNINPVNLGWKHFTITKQNHPNIRTYHLMHYVNSGSGYVEMNGKIEKVKKGDIFMISPGVEANWWRDSDDPEPWIYSWISFEATVSIDFLDFQILRQPNHRICHAFESVKKQSYEKSFDAGDFSTIYKILYEISQGVNSPPNQSMTTRIIYAKTYLDTHFTENISIQQVADSLYVNRRYLTKKFTSMMELRWLAEFLYDDEDAFAEMLAEKSNEDAIREQKHLEAVIQKSQSRMKKVEVFFEKLYEKNISGEVTDEWFMLQSQKYSEERMELKAKIADAQERLLSIDSIKQNKNNFIAAVRKFMEMDKLTAPLLKELIERIEVCHIEGVGKNRTQHFKIHYKFIGCFALPEIQKPRPVKLNTRQGVAVEYLPSAI